jgi:hypothetical protein
MAPTLDPSSHERQWPALKDALADYAAADCRSSRLFFIKNAGKGSNGGLRVLEVSDVNREFIGSVQPVRLGRWMMYPSHRGVRTFASAGTAQSRNVTGISSPTISSAFITTSNPNAAECSGQRSRSGGGMMATPFAVGTPTVIGLPFGASSPNRL